ncbi:MAG: ATP-binding protein [Parvibaculum sp.]
MFVLPTARDLAEPLTPFPSSATCSQVFDCLMAEGNLLNVPVVDEDVPVGLVSRQDFMLVFSRMYGKEIHGRSPITTLMNPHPIMIPADATCEEINAHVFVSCNSSPLQGFIVVENGKYLGLGSVATLMRVMADIMIRRAQELDAERKRAEDANASKTQFLAGMSHELRTPLNAIIGFADLIKMELFGKVQPARYLEYVNDIHQSGVHLLNMINELLDMAKIEAGRVELHETSVNPVSLGQEVMRMLRQSLAAGDLRIELDLKPCLPEIYADEQQVRRILLNLLSNAIKFTPPGGTITLRAGLTGDGCFEYVVTDTGIGIPQDKIERVLEPFEQVENSFTRSRAGTGLGLPLTKAMLEAHGGKLKLESQFGRGTRVSAILPASRIIKAMRARLA